MVGFSQRERVTQQVRHSSRALLHHGHPAERVCQQSECVSAIAASVFLEAEHAHVRMDTMTFLSLVGSVRSTSQALPERHP